MRWEKKYPEKAAKALAEWKKENREKVLEYRRNARRRKGMEPKKVYPDASPGNFVCRRCEKEKPISEFGKSNTVPRGHASYCLNCCREIQREISKKKGKPRRKSLDVDVEEGYKFCPRCESIKPLIEFRKSYCIACAREASIEWRQNNRDRHREIVRINGRRRELRLKVINGKHTPKQWQELKDKYDNKCLCCGEAKELTRDHIVPLSKGGTNNIENIQPLCMKCNRSKHTAEVDYRK